MAGYSSDSSIRHLRYTVPLNFILIFIYLFDCVKEMPDFFLIAAYQICSFYFVFSPLRSFYDKLIIVQQIFGIFTDSQTEKTTYNINQEFSSRKSFQINTYISISLYSCSYKLFLCLFIAFIELYKL